MKHRIWLCAILYSVSICYCTAQGWRYSEQFGTDFWTTQNFVLNEVDYDGSYENAMAIQKCMREDVQNLFVNPTVIRGNTIDTSGLYDKVATGVARQAPHGSSKERRTGNYNYNTSDQHQEWLDEKKARETEENERRRKEAIARKIAEDNRAAEVEAQTNAMLQAQTNRRIQKDFYNANQGAALAQQRARQAIRTEGPQFAKAKTSSSQRAQMLRSPNKPRRVMYPNRQARNTARKQLAQVVRQPLSPERAAMLKRALMVKAELRRKKKNENNYIVYKGIKISEHAVSSLGQDWSTESLKTPSVPPTSVFEERQALELHNLMRKEIMGATPLSPQQAAEFIADYRKRHS